MTVYRTRIGTIAMKAETTEGTAETSSLTSTVRVENLAASITLGQAERKIVSPSFGRFSSVPGSKIARITFRVASTGNSSLANVGSVGCETDLLLRAACFKQALSASTSATYTHPTTSDATLVSLTMRAHFDGVYVVIRGARGNVTISAAVGEPVYENYEFMGVYDHEQVTAAVPSVTYQTVTPAAFLGATFSINSVTTLLIRRFSLESGNVLVMRPDAANADGYRSCFIADAEAKIELEIEPELAATHDVFSLAEDATEMALSIVVGATTANIRTITATKLQYLGPQWESGGEQLVLRIPSAINRASGNDAFTMVWT